MKQQAVATYLYACFFDDNSVKVGRAKLFPQKRIRTHELTGQKRGVTVSATKIITVSHTEKDAEKELINHCAKIGAPLFGNEYFTLPGDGRERLASIMDDMEAASKAAFDLQKNEVVKIIITLDDAQHRALKDDAKANNRGLAMHTLHLALQDSEVSKRLAALLARKNPLRIRKGEKF